ncbi:hypothetical protein H310_02316 [Aphanomyces invadans]|uniref:RRM domain-containing protein n=1 Tax=Aphanomyces invadans TaxID=157072 RepID=A0A024UQN5_9STRA|nr:hypothetical protein H310_02316 [Aphanomyces invadans]ETW07908.1 hypothetical protein H310_02316 [Aphanomyces invadans]|eukprot:XP_008864001.1 hypothetical protein H310_02316 [Aphanomyces invadans]
MNVIKEIQRLNEQELEQGVGIEGSWHHIYRDSAWVYVGGLSYELTEGDILCVFSQVGEIEDINLVRDKDTGKSMGFSFIKYENHLSTVLAVDNFNGSTLLERMLRVDHVHKYKLPKELRDKEENEVADDEELRGKPGHAYEGKELANKFDIHQGVDVFKVKMTKDEKKKLKKAAKKAKKEKRRQADIEKKQIAYFEEIKLKRAARAAQEADERARRMQIEGVENPADFIMPSETGWRGRMRALAGISAAMPLSAPTTYGGLLSTTTWDQDRVFGCVCDSSWPVGLASGQVQASSWFGSDCSLQHCPYGDDPVTTGTNELDCSGVVAPGGFGTGTAGNVCFAECSNRGVCNYATGVCTCFEGFYGSNCGTMSVG